MLRMVRHFSFFVSINYYKNFGSEQISNCYEGSCSITISECNCQSRYFKRKVRDTRKVTACFGALFALLALLSHHQFCLLANLSYYGKAMPPSLVVFTQCHILLSSFFSNSIFKSGQKFPSLEGLSKLFFQLISQLIVYGI